MGVSVSFSRATAARPGHFPCNLEAVASPWLWFFPERLSRRGEGLSETNGRKRARSRGLRGAGRAIYCRPSLAYWGPANNWKDRECRRKMRMSCLCKVEMSALLAAGRRPDGRGADRLASTREGPIESVARSRTRPSSTNRRRWASAAEPPAVAGPPIDPRPHQITLGWTQLRVASRISTAKLK